MKHILSLSFIAFGFSVTAMAQLRPLSVEQMLKNDRTGLQNALPNLIGWQDNTHYILRKADFKSAAISFVAVDVLTGKEQPYTASAEKPKVLVRNNNIFYKASTVAEKQLSNDTIEEKNPTLSPDGTKVAFTRNNDLYIIDITTGKETRLTNDGSDVIYNGWASWVYYEEIFGRSSQYKAFWWNPDSKSIAYMRFDDSKVPLFRLFSATGQHGYVENTRYPKAGDNNPEVRIGFVDIETAVTRWSDFNEKDDQYFGTPFWAPDGKFWLQWMNRDQNDFKVYSINPVNGSKKIVYEEYQKTWVDWFTKISFLTNNKGYLIQSDKSGWMHIYHYSTEGKLITQLTTGDWAVKNILSINEKKGLIYFNARKENSARYDLYSVQLDGKNLTRLTFGEYNHNVSMSPGSDYFISTYSNVTTPPKMTLMNNEGKVICGIGDSKGKELDQYKFAKTELIRVKTPDGFDLPVTITWPTHFDNTKKYPVLISIYGGPNAGTVYDNWEWGAFGTTQWWANEGLIQVAIDHRSSGHFGKVGQNYIHRNLGDWETKDYSEVVKWLTKKPVIDAGKICITGFSYGGYMTCMALTKGADYFTHGIAGGSVVDWRLYDSHYTEKFMDTPEDNKNGYKSSAAATYIDNYKGNLYIVHGTMDDNVHMQNSIQLIGALQDKKKEFSFMLYPDGRHGWSNDKNKSLHQSSEKARYYYRYLLEKPVPEMYKQISF